MIYFNCFLQYAHPKNFIKILSLRGGFFRRFFAAKKAANNLFNLRQWRFA